ncbi:hypothetical protein N9C31_01510 [Gammaproteobacteria bacterium]|nr:hypothetical protein [Gammaproteobacteria bacterium]
MLKAFKINRWLVGMYMHALLQTLFVAVLVFVFSRVVGQFFSISAGYDLVDIFYYVMGVMGGEMSGFLPHLIMISLVAFVLKLHFNNYDQALQGMGYGWMAIFQLIGALVIVVFLTLSIVLDGFGKEQYQQAKFNRMKKNHETIEVWQKKTDGFYQLAFDPVNQVLSNVVRVAYQSRPEVQVVSKNHLHLKNGVWEDELGQQFDFDPPALMIHQILGASWLSLGQIIDLHLQSFELGWKLLTMRSYQLLSDSLEILLFFMILLFATRMSLRHSRWKEALLGSALIVLAQSMTGGQGWVLVLPLIAMSALIKWVK